MMPPTQKSRKHSGTSLNVLGYKEKDRHIAHCLEFDLVAEGSTPAEAMDNLADLIFTYLRFATVRGIEQFAYHPAPKVYWDKLKEIHRKNIPITQSIPPQLLKAPKDHIKEFMQKVDLTPTHA